jgi:AbrB family looped-hinge helix DNA binding protein
MSDFATLTSKGQMTLPKNVRERMKLKEGDQVEFIDVGGRTLIRPRNLRASDLAGVLGRPPSGESLTLEEIDDAIGLAVGDDDARIALEWREGQT